MPGDSYTGARIRRARKLLHLTQQELADKVGVSRNAIDSYENGRSYPKRYDVALEQVLNISLTGEPAPVAELTGEDDWNRWERSVLDDPRLPPDVARSIVLGARAAREEWAAGRDASARMAGRHRAAG